jgi:hypothetical protein
LMGPLPFGRRDPGSIVFEEARHVSKVGAAPVCGQAGGDRGPNHREAVGKTG